jgi:hypothetical protein
MCFRHTPIILFDKSLYPCAILLTMGTLAFLDKRSKLFWTLVGIILVVLLGMIDYWTGTELSITLFY